MDIQKLMKGYQKHFDEYNGQFDSKVPEKKKKKLERPNFLKEVMLPILNALSETLPEYGFTPPATDYAMYGEYYRVKGGIMLYGGISIGENFELYFTPLFHGQPCGETVELTTLPQLTEIIKHIYKQRKEL